MLEGARVTSPARPRASEPASLTDVAPTICHALGIAPPLQADGVGLPEVLADREQRRPARRSPESGMDAGRRLTGIQVAERDDGDRDGEAR